MRARVFVSLKPSVFDPQGTTVAEALHTLGYAAVKDVRQGKYFELEIDARTVEEARRIGSEAAVPDARLIAAQGNTPLWSDSIRNGQRGSRRTAVDCEVSAIRPIQTSAQPYFSARSRRMSGWPSSGGNGTARNSRT